VLVQEASVPRAQTNDFPVALSVIDAVHAWGSSNERKLTELPDGPGIPRFQVMKESTAWVALLSGPPLKRTNWIGAELEDIKEEEKYSQDRLEDAVTMRHCARSGM
jgi:hypothetical protein